MVAPFSGDDEDGDPLRHLSGCRIRDPRSSPGQGTLSGLRKLEVELRQDTADLLLQSFHLLPQV